MSVVHQRWARRVQAMWTTRHIECPSCWSAAHWRRSSEHPQRAVQTFALGTLSMHQTISVSQILTNVDMWVALIWQSCWQQLVISSFSYIYVHDSVCRSFLQALLPQLRQLAPLLRSGHSGQELFLLLLSRLLSLSARTVLSPTQPAFDFVLESYVALLSTK